MCRRRAKWKVDGLNVEKGKKFRRATNHRDVSALSVLYYACLFASHNL